MNFIEKNSRRINFIFLTLSIITAVFIVNYYVQVSGKEAFVQLPFATKFAIGLYIVLQLLKRFILKRIHWFDWLYYIGLISILLPMLLKRETGEWLFDVTYFGSFFLILSPLFGFITSFKEK